MTEPTIQTGLDGKQYLVFDNSAEREDHEAAHPEVSDKIVACFGGYENALLLKE